MTKTEVNMEGMFFVEKIIDKKTIKGVDHYLIKWLGYDK